MAIYCIWDRLGKAAILVGSIILTVTAGLKLRWILLEGLGVFAIKDPLFTFISNGTTVLAASALEITIAAWAISNRQKRPLMASGSLVWLGLLFSIYRLGLAVLGLSNVDCHCLGAAKSLTIIGGQTVPIILLCVIVLPNLAFCIANSRTRGFGRKVVMPTA